MAINVDKEIGSSIMSSLLAMQVGESRVCKVQAFPYLAIAASRICAMRTGTYVQHTGRALEPCVLKQAEAATEIQSAEMGPDMKSKQGAIFVCTSCAHVASRI